MTARKSTLKVEAMLEQVKELDRALIKEAHAATKDKNAGLVGDVELRRAEVFGFTAGLDWVLGIGLVRVERERHLTEEED